MRATKATAYWALMALVMGGCSKTAEKTANAPAQAAAQSTAKADNPENAIQQFLEAVRTGNDNGAAAMFTSLARERVSKLGIQVAPQGSDTASFTVGKVEYLAQDGARVAATWTDLAEDGKPRTDDMMWMVRKEPEGWRVAGMAATVFPGEPPLLLDFENPEDTIKQLELLRAEISRRDEQVNNTVGTTGGATAPASAVPATTDPRLQTTQQEGIQGPVLR